MPIFCPVCKRAMSSPNDFDQYSIHQCCDECAINFAEVRRAEWIEGWRPSVDEARQASTRQVIPRTC